MTTAVNDTLKVLLRENPSNTVLQTLDVLSNLDASSSYVQKYYDVSAYAGQTIRVYFKCDENSSLATGFYLDNVSVMVH